jgi:hypothetical protein
MEEKQVHFLYIQLALHLNVEITKSGFPVVLFELYIWLYRKLTQSCLSMIVHSRNAVNGEQQTVDRVIAV